MRPDGIAQPALGPGSSHTLAAVQRQLARFDAALRQRRGAFRVTFGARAFEQNIKLLSQQRVNLTLGKLSTFYHRLPVTLARAVRDEYWQLIRTLKLLADDVFIETLGPAATRSQRNVKVNKARRSYEQSLKLFVRSSPFLVQRPKGPTLKPLYPLPKTPVALVVFKTVMRELRAEKSGFPQQPDRRFVIDLAALRAQDALRGHLAKPVLGPLDERTLHFFGITFLLQQMFLVDMSENVRPSGPKDWYDAVSFDVGRMRNVVLGNLAQLERDAALQGNASRALQLNVLGNQLIEELTRVYSVRVEETVDLWAPGVKVLRRDKTFELSRTVLGTNGATETIKSYHGLPTPDFVRDPGSVPVADVVGKTMKNPVNVYGRVANRGSRLNDLNKPMHLRLRPSQTSLRDGTLVLVKGTLGAAGTQLAVTDSGPLLHSYKSSVGFRMPGGPGADEWQLQPDYRTRTEALATESRFEHQGDSIAATIAGQERLLTDLSYFPAVGALMRRRKRQSKPIDLHDSAFRGAVWNALYRALVASAHNQAFARLLQYLQRYLTHFTRHTLWNVRDGGRDYFRTRWPRSVSDQAVHDCGVYCVLVAHDIYRAVRGVSGAPRIEFGVITYLNHIALFGFADKVSFFVNNDTIYSDMPKRMPRGRVAKAQYALRQWAQRGFSESYGVRYSIALVRVPLWTISTALPESRFKRVLWARYKRFAVWWGLQPGIAATHHEQIKLYDEAMRKLEPLVSAGPKAMEDPSSATMVVATTLATALFKDADALVDKSRYGPRPGFHGRIRHERAVAVVAPRKKEPPLYLLVQALLKASKALTPDQAKLITRAPNRAEHAKRLAAKAF